MYTYIEHMLTGIVQKKQQKKSDLRVILYSLKGNFSYIKAFPYKRLTYVLCVS